MNLSLVEPSFLAKELPETLQDAFRSGHSTCIRFSHRGDLLASGRLDGAVVIFDCDTNSVARKLKGHLRQVQSLSWSADDRYLLSASQDWRAVLWDLKTGQRLRIVRFEAPIFVAELHPTNHLLFVVALFDDQPMLVDIQGEDPIKRTLPSAPKRSLEELAVATEKQTAQDAKQTTTVATFSTTGDHLFCGTNKGWVNIIETETCQTVASSRISSSIVILIKFSATARMMATYTSDRVIRTFSMQDITVPGFDFDTFHLEEHRQHQDHVNKLAYNYVCVHPNGEYVIGTLNQQHNISIWEEQQGSLIKIFETTDENAILDFHPHKPFLAAVGVEEGRIYFYSVPTPQSWAALAPDFVEVEENVEFIEAEDEFDIQPPEELTKRRLDLEDEEVDVLTMDPVKSHQFQPGDFTIPVIMDNDASDSEDEVIAIGAGQFRRKTAGQEWSTGDADYVASGDESKKSGSVGNGRAGNGSKRKQRGD